MEKSLCICLSLTIHEMTWWRDYICPNWTWRGKSHSDFYQASTKNIQTENLHQHIHWLFWYRKVNLFTSESDCTRDDMLALTTFAHRE